MRAIVVGAGPVACLVALGLRQRGIEVDLFERRGDMRIPGSGRGHSFNLTLTLRGLRALDGGLRDRLYAQGVTLPQRIVHHVDGSLSFQQYGTAPEHHLLSIPRAALNRTLLDAAEAAGARFHFHRECLGADPERARITVAVDGSGLREVQGDILVGCDGANSVVRQEMSRRAPMSITQDYLDHGYVELRMPAGPDGRFALAQACLDDEVPASRQHGLHIWPRGRFMLLSQPNIDRSYTTSLFMPHEGSTADGPGLQDLTSSDGVHRFFAEYFPDVVPLLPDLVTDLTAEPAAHLRTLRCAPYHHGRTVLVGDAAHTMVPFYGQGINCSFEDVATLLHLLDEHSAAAGYTEAVPGAVADFTDSRRPAGDAITDLSLANLHELSVRTGEREYQSRSLLEKKLHRTDPARFIPLYDMVAFTDIPYDEVVHRHERDRPVVDELLGRSTAAAPAATSARELVLTPEQATALLGQVAGRLSSYHEDLAAGRYPASYLHGAGGGPAVVRPQPMDPLPIHGSPVDGLLDEVFEGAITGGMVHPHPGFLAQVPSGGLFQAAVGEFIARTLNRFVSVDAAAPGMARIETSVIRWFTSMLGYGPESFGYLTTGGSIANLMGLRCGLTPLGPREGLATGYVSEQGHYSVVKAARLVGIPPERLVTVGVHPDDTMNLVELRARIDADAAAGAVPAVVVATAGTTNTGAVDDLRALVELCRSLGVWLHVDACLGGFFRLTERGRSLLDGIEEADSIAVDAHKSLFLPHGSSALLVKRRSTLHAAFAVPDAAYIPELDTDDEPVDLCNFGPELTREMRGLGAWLPLKMHGVTAFTEALDRMLDLADNLAERLRAVEGVRVAPRGRPHLPVVSFAMTGIDEPTRDRRTRRICERICSAGRVYVATTRLRGVGLVIRACVLQPRTGEDTIGHLIEDLCTAIRIDDEETT